MERKDFEFLSSVISWIMDDMKRKGATELAILTYSDNPNMKADEFRASVQEKVRWNQLDEFLATRIA